MNGGKAIYFDSEKYFSLREASKIAGYHRDYLGQLCRSEQIVCRQIGNQWFVQEKSLISYKSRKSENGNNFAILKNQGLEIKKTKKIEFVNIKSEEWMPMFQKILAVFRIKILDTRYKIQDNRWEEALFGEIRNTKYQIQDTKYKLPNLKFISGVAVLLIVGFLVFQNPQGAFAKFSDAQKIIKRASVIAISAVDDTKKNIKLAFGRTIVLSKTATSAINDIKKNIESTIGQTFSIIDGLKDYSKNKISAVISDSGAAVAEIKSEQDFVSKAINIFKNVGLGTKEFVFSFFQDAGKGIKTIGRGIKDAFKSSLVKLSQNFQTGEETKKIPEEKTIKFKAISPQSVEVQDELADLRREIGILKTSGLRVEKIIEKPTVVERTIQQFVSEVTKQDLETQLNQVNNKILSQYAELKNLIAERTQANFNALALSQRINTLSNVAISSPTISSPTISGTGSLGGSTLSISSTAAVSGNTTLSADLNVDGGTLYVDSSNNRVGVGTTSPQYALDVDGVLRVTSLVAGGQTISGNLGVTGNLTVDGNTGIGTTSPWAKLAVNPVAGDTNQFVVGSSTATSFVITPGGNVGIGTTSPNAKFVINSTGASAADLNMGRVFATDLGNGYYSFFSVGKTTGAANNFSIGFTENATDADTYGFLSVAGDDPTAGTGLIVRKGGNVGIGTTSPSEALELASSKNIRLSDNTQIQLGSAVTDNSSISSRLSLQRLETAGTFPGRGPGGAAATGLYLQIPQPNSRVMGLMIGPEPSPVGRSDGGAPFALLVNGDMLIGDIFTISSAVISAFARQTTQTAVVGTVLMSNTSTNTDGTGGAAINLNSDANPAGVNNNAGSLFLTAFGRGTGSFANSIIFQTRSEVSSVAKRAVLDGNGNFALGIGAVDSARFHAYNNASTTLNIGEFEAAVAGYTGTSLIASNTLGAASTYNLFSAITDSDGDQGGSVTQFLIRGDGRVGIGTTSPYAKLSVEGSSALGNSALAGYFTATTSTASVFPYASSTAITISGTASTTNMIVAGDTTLSKLTASRLLSLDSSKNIASVANLASWVAGASNQLTVTDDGDGSITLSLPVLVSFTQASSTRMSVFDTLYVGGTATTTVTGSAVNVPTGGSYQIAGTSVLNATTLGSGVTGSSLTSVGTLTSLTVSGDLTIDTDTLYANSATNIVGVGTTSPWAKLAVNPVAGDANQFVVGSSTATSFVITPGGNVGIGTTSPAVELFVNSTTDNPSQIVLGRFGSATRWGIYRYGSAESDRFNIGVIGTNEPFTITTVGNVGIGTTSPAALLSVAGNTYLTGGLGVGLVNTSANTVNLATGGSYQIAGTSVLNATTLGSGVTGSSLTSVGTLTSLTVSGDLTIDTDTLYANSATNIVGVGTTSPWAKLAVNPVAGDANQFVVGSSTATSFVITPGGNVGIGTTSPNAKFVINSTGASAADLNMGRVFATDLGNGYYSFFSVGKTTGAANNFSIGFTENATDADTYGFLSVAGDDPTAGTGLIVRKGGNVGIGTTSPYAKLSVVGQVVAPYFTATTSTASVFPYASSTAITISGTASTTNMIVAGDTTLSKLTASRLLSLDSSKNIASVANLASWVAGTSNQLTVADDADGTITLSLPQSIATASAPQFARLGLGGAAHATDILTITSTDTTADSKALNIAHSGAITGTGYGLYVSKTGGSTTNVGGYFSATGATNNYGLIVENGLVGIGTTSPWAKLAVNPVAGDTNQFVVGSSTATSFVITPGGRVGIGTASPSAKRLHVEGPAGDLAIFKDTTASPGGQRVWSLTNVNDVITTSFDNTGVMTTNNYLQWGAVNASAYGRLDTINQAGAGNIGISALGALANINIILSPQGSGGVGIGTTTPWGKFAVVNSSGTTDAVGRFQAAIGGYTGTSLIAENTLGASSAYRLFEAATDADGDAGGRTVQFVIRGDGNVGVGTTSPSQLLAVQGNAYLSGNLTNVANITATGTLAVSGSATLSGGATITCTGCITNTNVASALTGKTYNGLTITSSTGTLTIAALKTLTANNTLAFSGTDSTTFTFPSSSDTVVTLGATQTLTAKTLTSPTIQGTVGAGTGLTMPAFTLGGAVTGNSQDLTGLNQLTVTGTTATSTFSTGGLTVGTSQFVVQQTSGNVGIGTATPSSILEVSKTGASAANLNMGRFFASDLGNGFYSFITTGRATGAANNISLGFVENATDADTYGFLALAGDDPTTGTGLIVRKGGNVGIGTTTPATLIDVNGTATIRSTLALGNTGLSDGVLNSDGSLFVNIDANNNETTAALEIGANRTGGSGGSSLIRIQENGSIGIGTTTPSSASKLHVLNESATVGDVSIIATRQTAGYGAISAAVKGDAFARLYIDSNGALAWGSGAATQDTNLYRSAADTLFTDDKFGLATLGTTDTATHLCRNTSNLVAGCSADYPEWYPGDGNISAGDVVFISNIPNPIEDPTAKFLMKQSENPYDKRLLGVVSDPLRGASGERKNDNYMPLVLIGRVPIKVSLENGPVNIGDRITSSSVPGVGMKAAQSGQAVGIALESLSSESQYETGKNYGKILFFANLGYYKIDESVINSQMFVIDQSSGRIKASYGLDLSGNDLVNVLKIVSASGLWSIDEQGKLIVQEIETQKLKVKSPSGFTIYDEDTGQPVCVKSKSGALVTVSGECGQSQQSAISNQQSAADSGQPTADSQSLDSEPSVITIHGNNPAEIAVGTSYGDLGASAQDNIDGDISLLIKTYVNGLEMNPAQIDTSTTTTYIIEYAVSDQAGNSATSSRQVIVYDQTPTTP